MDGAASAAGGEVIDCGTEPGSAGDTRREIGAATPVSAGSQSTTRPYLTARTPAAKLESPANTSLVARDQRVAVQDYRFGQVRVESVDIVEMGDRGDRAGVRRGESSTGTAKSMKAGLAANDNPVRVTKGRFEQLEGKNTEAGWGIVHLYRDGEETPGLNGAVDVPTQSDSDVASGAMAAEDAEEKGKMEAEEEDCTTLCVPAVPTYLT